jgi:hypothetical protein
MPGFDIKLQGNRCNYNSETKEGEEPDGKLEGADPRVETARKHRYAFTILDPLKDVLLYAYKCGRPTCEADRIVICRGQDEIYKPGRSRWLPIEITFYEPVSPNYPIDYTAALLHKWYGKTMINIRKGSTISQDSDYKQQCILRLLDGRDRNIWAYNMYGVWPSNITPSELSYADTSLAEISCTLNMDKVIENRQEEK